MRKIPTTLLAVISFFVWQVVIPPNGVCSANDANDIQYLIFWPGLPGATSAENFEAAIRNFAVRLGTTGDSKTRQLGFGNDIPIFISDESKIAKIIKFDFDMARRTNVAVHFNVDDHINWDERPDLWNWYDPAKKGYNPGNKNNVEWYDWEGTPSKRRYFTPEATASQSPHMCYNSPAVEKEINRIVFQFVGPALREEINRLKQEHKEYLFAGITVGQEAGFDDYSDASLARTAGVYPMPLVKKMMAEDKAPHSRVGYCALKNAGYSKSRPPANINAALTDINQKFIEFWDKQFFDVGIPGSRIYTHVAASGLQDDNNNAPNRIVFNRFARPGWTTYPQGILENGFQPLYDELAKHGNPAWGGVEANAVFGSANRPVICNWETYLAWHFNHGAKLVGINIGASDQSLMVKLRKGAFDEEAMAAYRKFLSGKTLREAQLSVSTFSPKRFHEKIQLIEAAAPAWAQKTGRPEVIQSMMMKIDAALKANRLEDADKTADEILKLIK